MKHYRVTQLAKLPIYRVEYSDAIDPISREPRWWAFMLEYPTRREAQQAMRRHQVEEQAEGERLRENWR